MTTGAPSERRFSGEAARLRSAERVARLEPERVVAYSLQNLHITSVLDIGTGTGLFAEAFSAAGTAVTGIDVRSDLLAVAQQHLPEGRFVNALAEFLPFDDKSFDLVFLAHVLHEADDLSQALREAARTARRRVVIVEYPYRQEESGPPLEHRLPGDRIESLAAAVGLYDRVKASLTHVDLYAFSAF
ncbi:MAG TPA: class I SAM-dependent methyltransferase [bacterium]|jgi:ubiquinone/menaquinone biosynthesis C-methylase UbiE|nr:class I SAM-dependent methyltransferase [bacterium]HNT64238.1 class I SAM-dependent methyltransferase [bacterium]HOX85228.1 class I SAM-dependent methyltransferase [bacterium]HPG44387.1 class I SAM-dependent methyltransferase [bacterium]HPM96945.1 class I SAM-dependent methyltransferase [bacterium]